MYYLAKAEKDGRVTVFSCRDGKDNADFMNDVQQFKESGYSVDSRVFYDKLQYLECKLDFVLDEFKAFMKVENSVKKSDMTMHMVKVARTVSMLKLNGGDTEDDLALRCYEYNNTPFRIYETYHSK